MYSTLGGLAFRLTTTHDSGAFTFNLLSDDLATNGQEPSPNLYTSRGDCDHLPPARSAKGLP